MTKRLCFLLPDVKRTRIVIERLRAAGIGEANMMVVAKDGTPLDDLPEADVERTDFYPNLERGLAAGGVIGAIAGLIVLRFSPLGLILGGAAIPFFTLFGAGVSGFMGALGGASFASSRLTQFEDAVARGEILVVVTTAKDKVREIETLVKEAHAEAEFVGMEPHSPVIPP
jgi:hypothetical protein